MKELLKTMFITSLFIVKIEIIALSVALVLWLVGLFGVTGGDVSRVLGILLGGFTVSLVLFVIIAMKK